MLPSPSSIYDGDTISQDLPISHCRIHIIRPGQALHNVKPNYTHRDPPLTKHGISTASNLETPTLPDLIIVSPTTRAIQTALAVFGKSITESPEKHKIQVWPELREAHDASCNIGLSKLEIEAKYPQFDCSRCSEHWNYAPHTVESAAERAEEVRRELKQLASSYRNIALITHHRLIAFLVAGSRFDNSEVRSYRFAEEYQADGLRLETHVDTLLVHDFGPTVLVKVATDP